MTLWIALAGCGKSVPAVVPEPHDLAPLEADNRAPDVPADGDDLHPEASTSASGQFDDGIYWAHAKANVAAEISVVWACFQDPDTVVDRREVDLWTTSLNVEPDFDFSMTLHQTVDDLITISYDTLWLHEAQEGTPEDPLVVVATWQKSDGTDFIQLLSGSAVLTVADDGVTSLALVAWLDAASRDEVTLVSYLADLAASVTACAHGEPLPWY